MSGRGRGGWFVALGLVLALGACSGGASVGDEVDVGQGAGGDRLSVDGDATTTTNADPSQSPSGPDTDGSSGDGGSPRPAEPPTTAPTQQPPPTSATTTTVAIADFEITIHPDTSGQPQFEPSQARVFEGTLVRWTNVDSEPRSVVASDGAFDSGEIPPGETFEYHATALGRFDYSDGTRPYAVATLEVVAR